MRKPKERFVNLVYDAKGELLLIESMNVPDWFREKVIETVKDLRIKR